jgi:hypothetical protein
MSPDHRKRQIDEGSFSRSRDRWRPPDQERIRRPAGDRTAALENTGDNNSSAPLFRRKQPNLQAQRASETRRLRRQRYAARIWRLGDRVLFELVDQIAGRFDLEDEVDRLLDRFAGLDPVVLRALGGDRLPSNPTRIIGGAR